MCPGRACENRPSLRRNRLAHQVLFGERERLAHDYKAPDEYTVTHKREINNMAVKTDGRQTATKISKL